MAPSTNLVVSAPWPLVGFYESDHVSVGPNDSSINCGDSEDTGDNQASPDELGSGSAESTIDSTSLGGTNSITQPSSGGFDAEQERKDYDGLEIMEANDGRLGLTGIDGVEAEGSFADTGELRSGEEF